MHEKSLAQHCKPIHDNDFKASATCVDIGRGLYLVQRGFHGGFGFPIHVKVLETSPDGTCVECKHDSCMDGLKVAWRSGLKTAECCHLKQAGPNPVFIE